MGLLTSQTFGVHQTAAAEAAAAYVRQRQCS